MIRIRSTPAALGLAAGLALLPRPAAAQTFSPWQATQSTTPSGRDFCAISTATRDEAVVRNVFVKVFPAENSVFINLLDVEWDRSQGSEVAVAIDFADDQPLDVVAYADGVILDIEFPADLMHILLLELAERNAIRFAFPDENVAPWVVPTVGAREAVQDLASCVRSFSGE